MKAYHCLLIAITALGPSALAAPGPNSALPGDGDSRNDSIAATSRDSERRNAHIEVSVKFLLEIRTDSDLRPHRGLGRKLLELLVGRSDLQLERPVGLLSRAPGELVVLDQGRRSLLGVSLNQRRIGDLGGGGDYFPSLVALCARTSEDILFTDSVRERVFVAARAERPRIFDRDVQLEQPTGIGYHPLRDEIWVAETKAHRLAVLDRSGRLLRRIGGRGSAAGEFNYPTSLWIDAEGQVFVVDAMNFRVQIFDSGGHWLSMFGEEGNAAGYFARPKGIATDRRGHVYVVDGLFGTVQIFDAAGRFLFNFGKQGSGPGQFRLPSGIFIDRRDFIYVADSYNSRVQIFQLIGGERVEF